MSDISLGTELRSQPRVTPAPRLDLSRLGFGPFIFMNVMLLLRLQELFPVLAELHLYEFTMLLCMAIYWPRIWVAMRLERLRQTPITVCVVALLPVTIWSIVWHSRMDMISGYAVEYLKIVVYYMILVVAVDTPARLRRFVLSLAVIIAAVAAVAVGHHLDLWKIDTIQTLIDKRDNAVEGMLFLIRSITIKRLIGVGIFADPNDLAQILGVGMVLAVYGFELSRWAITKALWVLPMIVMAAGIYYTKSRGGLLAMFAGLGILFMARFGIKKAIIVGTIVLVPMLFVFRGYQTSISTDDDSTQARVQLWSDSLQAMRENLAFGISPGVMNEYAGQVSHNSFLSAFAETGFPGGFLFLTAYAIAIFGVFRMRSHSVRIVDPDIAKLTPVLCAATVCYAVGMMSLTRNYVIPTYLILGLATVYLRFAHTEPEKEPITCSMGLLGKSFALAVCFLLAMQVFVKAFVRWG